MKDYAPVYIDARLKDKLQTLVASLQHLAPDVSPTMLLSNILIDHITRNEKIIKETAREGLSRSLERTFKD